MCHLQGMSCKQWLTMLAPAKFTTESNTKQPDLVSTFAYVLSFFQYKSHCYGMYHGPHTAAWFSAGLRQLSTLASLHHLDVSGCMNVDAYRALYLLRVRPSALPMRTFPSRCCWLQGSIKAHMASRHDRPRLCIAPAE